MEALLQQLRDIDAKLDALLLNDELTDAQKAEHDALQKERKAVEGKVRREQERIGRAASLSALEASATATLAAQQAAADAAEEAKVEAQRQADIAAGRKAREIAPRTTKTTPDAPTAAEPARLEAPPAKPPTIPARVRRFGTLTHFSRVRPRAGVNDRPPEEKAFRFAVFALSHLVQQNPQRFGHMRELVDRHMTAVTSMDATGAHYLIPEEFGTDLIDLREQYGVARRICKMVPMTSDTRTDPRRRGGLTASFIGEGGTISESSKNWDNVRLTAKDLYCLSRVTAQVNMDNVINWGDDLAGEIAYAFSNKEDDCCFNGDGTATYGHISGIRNKLANCDNAGTASAGLQTGSGATWASLVNADFDATIGLLPQYADTASACWVMHRTFFYNVVERLVQAAGGTMSYEIREGNRNGRPLYKGYPVEFSQIMPSASAGATVSALLGDFKLGVSFGDRMQDAIAFSEHATIGSENVFERNELAIRGWERFDINAHDCGTSSTPGPIVGLKTS